jgi:hypothetical protein
MSPNDFRLPGRNPTATLTGTSLASASVTSRVTSATRARIRSAACGLSRPSETSMTGLSGLSGCQACVRVGGLPGLGGIVRTDAMNLVKVHGLCDWG